MCDAHAARIEELERRLFRLEAAEAARSLLARYARACDRRDLPAVTALFSTDGSVEAGGRTWTGAEQISDFFRDSWSGDPSDKTHFIVNMQSGEAPAGAVAVHATFMYTAAGDTSSVLGWGEYRDVVDLSGPAPVFRSKHMEVTWAGDIRRGWARQPVASGETPT